MTSNLLNSQELRNQAEAQLSAVPQLDAAVYSNDKLLYELQVQQIELELQNEELRRTQQALEVARDRYLDLYEFAPVGYVILSANGTIENINLTGATLLGEERSKLLSLHFTRLIDNSDRDRWQLFFWGLMRFNSGKTIELKLKRPDNKVFHAQLKGLKMPMCNGAEGVRLILSDISERKQLETVTLHCERYQLAESGSATAIWDWDIVTGQIRYAERWYQMLGHWSHNNRNTFTYWETLLHPDDREETLKRLWQHLKERTPFVTEYRLRMGNGQYRWLHASGQAVWDELGQPIRMTGTVHDITECKQYEAELRIASALESRDGIIVTDANGLILRVNQTFINITGYSSDEVIGKNPSILQSGRQNPDFYAAMWESLNNTGTWEGEIWNRRKNGEIYPEHLNITAVKDQNGKVTNYVATFTNIAQAKQQSKLFD